MKNSLDRLNSRFERAKGSIVNLEIDHLIETIQSDEQGGKKNNEKNEQSLEDLWSNIKQTNLCVMIVSEGEERDNKNLKK